MSARKPLPDLGPLPRIHPREQVVSAARNELANAVLEVIQTHELTEGEALKVVSQALGEWLGSAATHMIRDERHRGNPDKPGGWA